MGSIPLSLLPSPQQLDDSASVGAESLQHEVAAGAGEQQEVERSSSASRADAAYRSLTAARTWSAVRWSMSSPVSMVIESSPTLAH
jgi:hypothetical protein